MACTPGSSCGPYEVLEQLGSGGMGEVYRARDPRLDREVALKSLPQRVVGDPAALARFEREAKAVAALSHPNILAVYEFRKEGDDAYVVTELLEGETLRERLTGGPLPPRKAVELAQQIARGLAAAHDKGIVHRDLKPDNIFVTRQGRAKILDFGLARAIEPEDQTAVSSEHSPTRTHLTSPGSVVGTAAYMSPEQVRARPVDHRSDLFAFGAVLHEMLTGQQAFTRESAADTMAAVLREDPAQPKDSGVVVPPALDRLVQRCLEKQPEERFQSARDLAFALENALGTSGTGALPAIGEATGDSARRPARRWLWWPLGAAVLIGGVLIGRATMPPAPVNWDYSQLTYRQGVVTAARFGNDGRTVLYTASWDGEGARLYSTMSASPESQALGLENAELLSVSSRGELALLLDARQIVGFMRRGTLARMPFGGGAARELRENVHTADWHPAGDDLAVVVTEGAVYRLEYPPGNVLYETSGWIGDARFSPDGGSIAFSDHPLPGDTRGHVSVVDLEGGKLDLTGDFSSLYGMAWSGGGNEIWFTAGDRGTNRAVYAVDLRGEQRVVISAPIVMTLYDISREGQVLLARDNASRRMIARPPGADAEVLLTWLDWSFPARLSDDGETVLFVEQGEGGGAHYTSYVRPTRGGPAVRVAQGSAMDLSGDGERALIVSMEDPTELTIYPTGAGEARRVDTGGVRLTSGAFLDEDRLLLIGRREGRPLRAFVIDVEGGEPRAVTPEGIAASSVGVLPDGRGVLARAAGGPMTLYPMDGGEPRPIPGVGPDESPCGFTADGGSVYLVTSRSVPAPVVLMNLRSGARQPVFDLAPAEPAGVTSFGPVNVTPDARGYLYSYRRVLSTLYLAEPAGQPGT